MTLNSIWWLDLTSLLSLLMQLYTLLPFVNRKYTEGVRNFSVKNGI